MREYHCNTCDFHITGPADEVADEIEAHEEQHHTEAAKSDIEVTPELLRAVRWAALHDARLSDDICDELEEWAARIERKQSDEKRIDELARISYAAESEAARGHVKGQQVASWDEASDLQKDVTRAGIRAVLAKLDEEREQPFDKGGHTVQPLRQWEDLRDVPDDVLAVCATEGVAHRDSTAHNGWRWINSTPVSEYSLTAFAPYTEIPEATR
ncbi:hypothetical protein [Rhodococcus pyridinivorans]|uniref:Uncharacterized protein n=1 Tax=Rhodococcus pyridinivorans TaxID=103816 RepID=A0A7M2XHP4_9NOCA|nr:hypothetical protein [Rhodococcus pyridinivorans]QOV97179.1 hypothetical protein INP59_14475 [Rhodococcus pyridinivorans]